MPLDAVPESHLQFVTVPPLYPATAPTLVLLPLLLAVPPLTLTVPPDTVQPSMLPPLLYPAIVPT